MAEISDKLAVYTLGHTGVIIDQNPLEPSVPNDALKSAQNAMHDPTMEYGGGIRKRPGLARFNSKFAGGVILGGIPMPVAGTGGAPASGGGAIIGTGDSGFDGGFTGDSTGTGDGTGAPGATFDGGDATYPIGAPILFNGGSSIFSGARLVVFGRMDNTIGAEGGAGWYVSSKGLADSANSLTTPGPPVGSYSYPAATPFLDAWGTPSCILNDRLYYAGTHGSQTTGSAAPIRVTDGATDALVATVPVNGYDNAYANYPTLTGGKRQAIVCMHAGSDGNIYLGVKDKFYGQATNGSVGRVFKLVPSSGALTEINTGVAAAVTPPVYTAIPYCLSYFDGKVYWGEWLPQSAVNQTVSVYATSSDGTYSVADRTFAPDNASVITSMQTYSTGLFVGTGCYQNTNLGASQLALLNIRFPGGTLGDTANWLALSFDLARTGNNVNGNYYTSMVEFNGSLYVCWYAPASNTQIYKISNVVLGATAAIGATMDPIVSVFNNTSTFPFYLFVDDGVMYAVAVIDGTPATRAYVTTDGTSWTVKSANLPTFANTSRFRPIFYGVNQ